MTSRKIQFTCPFTPGNIASALGIEETALAQLIVEPAAIRMELDLYIQKNITDQDVLKIITELP